MFWPYEMRPEMFHPYSVCRHKAHSNRCSFPFMCKWERCMHDLILVCMAKGLWTLKRYIYMYDLGPLAVIITSTFKTRRWGFAGSVTWILVMVSTDVEWGGPGCSQSSGSSQRCSMGLRSGFYASHLNASTSSEKPGFHETGIVRGGKCHAGTDLNLTL